MPSDPARAAIERALEDEPTRERLRAAGPPRAALFTWEEAAAPTVPMEQQSEIGEICAAAMRKLIHLAYGVLKTGRPFDPELKTA